MTSKSHALAARAAAALLAALSFACAAPRPRPSSAAATPAVDSTAAALAAASLPPRHEGADRSTDLAAVVAPEVARRDTTGHEVGRRRRHGARGDDGARSADSAFTKHLEFAILEDWDKGTSLAEVERDFRLFRELGITTWRGSFGWDDYEPTRGRFDFAWLHRFAELARRDGLTLRPYLGYTAEWAAIGRRADGNTWNDPPKRPADFARFAGRLAAALRRHGDVASYEIYNEENTKFWWDGTVAEYADVFAQAADSVRAADPHAAVVMGGLVWPDASWATSVCARPGHAARVDAVPVHVYSETWTPDSVTLERTVADLAGRDFRETLDGPCGGAALWANEIGFATAHGKTERQQADWWVRAIAALAADRRVALIGVYEIKDLKPGSAVIGEPENFHLGITRADRTPKLAFYTVKMLVAQLAGDVTVDDADLRATARESGATPPPDAHLFRRPDGRQLLIAWVRPGGTPVTLDVTLPRCGARATRYALDGKGSAVPLDGGTRLGALRVEPLAPLVVAITPASGDSAQACGATGG
jgi:hypothetical protein